MSDLLDAFARRLRGDREFLASAMEDFARSEGLDGAELARHLGVERDVLGRLGLSRRPAGERFTRDVRIIAERFGIDELVLAEMVRRSDALGTLRHGHAAAAAVAAARDRRGPMAAKHLPAEGLQAMEPAAEEPAAMESAADIAAFDMPAAASPAPPPPLEDEEDKT